MKVLRIISLSLLAIIGAVFSACATAMDDEELGMIPPSANYSPIQAPVYPPLNQPYSPNLLNENDGRVMNIDRLNVGEANIPNALMPGANLPNTEIVPNSTQNTYMQNGNGGNGAYESHPNDYVSDYTQEYVPSYIAPSEVVPYEQVLPEPQQDIPVPQQTFPAPVPSFQAQQQALPAPQPMMPPQIVPFSPLPEQAKSPEIPPIVEHPASQQHLEPEAKLDATKELEPKAPNIIPNSPHLESENIIELSAVGMGVAPESTISPSQALALAKRAAIIDAYRQIGEKMYGIKINGKDTVKDMILTNSVVKARVDALIKNADIVETIYKDGLCQVTMELKLDGRTWSKILSVNG